MGSALSRQLDVFYIFLDVDGVLNSAASRGPAKETHAPTATALGHVAAIATRAASAGLGECRVVLSSTWRLKQSSLERVAAALASVGLTIHSCTPDLEASCQGDRVDEIIQWLLQENASDEVCWVAIDDLDLLAMNGKLKAGNFVRTDDATGLGKNEVDEAVAKLRIQHKQRTLQRSVRNGAACGACGAPRERGSSETFCRACGKAYPEAPRLSTWRGDVGAMTRSGT